MNQVDLHTHTTASDGQFTPAQLVQRACRVGLKVLAVTDHDTVAGVADAQAAGATCGVEVIPGVEINTDVPGAEVHVLGYFIDPGHAELNEQLARIREGRVGRAKKMAEVLTEMGAPIRFERILEIAGEGSVGRPHVAQALLEAGHISSYSEAFTRYIGRESPAYIERMKFTPAEACALICRAGGLPVLAHPVHFDRWGKIKARFDEGGLLPGMLEAGLAGMEVYYTGYDAVTIEQLLNTARHYGLLATGGTDFHGIRPNEPDLGGVYVPMKVVRRLKEKAAANLANSAS
ncbi:MAG: PHP domain-containing protein [Anaerolineae bacterium]|nr:PHP domain-containing protein [Anaerolineae bacterium]